MTPEEAEPVDLMIFATKEGGLRGAMETAAGFIWRKYAGFVCAQRRKQRRDSRGTLWRDQHFVLHGSGHGRGEGGQCAGLMRHAGMIVLGEKLPGEITPRVQAVADFLNAHGVTAKPVGDMVRRQWGKLMLNVGLNQTVMVFEGDYGTVQQPGKPRDIMIAAMREVQKLAAMEGYPISDEEFDDWVKLADSLSPAGKPSMRQDGEAHRKSEVELFAGTIIRRAARFGLDVPVNRWLYDTVKKMEAAY